MKGFPVNVGQLSSFRTSAQNKKTIEMVRASVVWSTGHCPVCQPRHLAVGFRPLELLTTGPPDSPVVHRTVIVHCLVRLLALL